jgi:EAL domain-containing protein (putative c-di-GMP-specific phosphodiesterase class I)
LAENVESEDAFKLLRSTGIDLFQGYHFAPPMPVSALVKKKSA